MNIRDSGMQRDSVEEGRRNLLMGLRAAELPASQDGRLPPAPPELISDAGDGVNSVTGLNSVAEVNYVTEDSLLFAPDPSFSANTAQAPIESACPVMLKSPLRFLVPGLRKLLKRCEGLPIGVVPADYDANILAALEITVRAEGGQPEELPASGPLVLAAKRPYGGADGLIAASLLARARPYLKILAIRSSAA
jgi:hypothetical protein